MNRQYKAILPVILLLFFLSGCQRQTEEEETGYLIYYNTADGTQLQTVSYLPSAQSFEELMEELAGQLASAPAGLESVLGDDVEIQGYQRGIDALRIDFSRAYYELDNVSEVLLRAAVVKTFSQIPGVTGIMITVDGAQLLDAEGDPVPVMDRDDFINTKEGGINSYQYVTLSLYFVEPDSGKLRRETRSLHYSSNMVLENVVAEQLILGPDSDELAPVFLDTVKILSVHVQDGICIIDFDSAVNEWPPECTASAQTVLYALVNSVCDTCDDVTGVRIRIGGESDAVFREEVPLNQVFYMELSEVESYTETDAEPSGFSALETELSGGAEDMALSASGADGEDGGTAGGSAEAEGDDAQRVSGSVADSPAPAEGADSGTGHEDDSANDSSSGEESGDRPEADGSGATASASPARTQGIGGLGGVESLLSGE